MSTQNFIYLIPQTPRDDTRSRLKLVNDLMLASPSTLCLINGEVAAIDPDGVLQCVVSFFENQAAGTTPLEFEAFRLIFSNSISETLAALKQPRSCRSKQTVLGRLENEFNLLGQQDGLWMQEWGAKANPNLALLGCEGQMYCSIKNLIPRSATLTSSLTRTVDCMGFSKNFREIFRLLRTNVIKSTYFSEPVYCLCLAGILDVSGMVKCVPTIETIQRGVVREDAGLEYTIVKLDNPSLITRLLINTIKSDLVAWLFPCSADSSLIWSNITTILNCDPYAIYEIADVAGNVPWIAASFGLDFPLMLHDKSDSQYSRVLSELDVNGLPVDFVWA